MTYRFITGEVKTLDFKKVHLLTLRDVKWVCSIITFGKIPNSIQGDFLGNLKPTVRQAVQKVKPGSSVEKALCKDAESGIDEEVTEESSEKESSDEVSSEIESRIDEEVIVEESSDEENSHEESSEKESSDKESNDEEEKKESYEGSEDEKRSAAGEEVLTEEDAQLMELYQQELEDSHASSI